MIQKLFFFSFCLLFLQQATSQDLQVKTGPGQNPVREKIYVHSDKDFYLAGEIIWFKLYCLDAATNQPLHISKVAYVDILDHNNKPVLQAKIDLGENNGSGSFYLPLTIVSDRYVLRAYTNLMKNSGNAFFFEKVISIVNTMKPTMTGNAVDSSRAHVDFFPEGGQLVEGLTSRIGFRVAGDNGQGASARGLVISSSGDTVVQFTSLRYGMGHFDLTPAIGKTYKALVLLPDGKAVEQALPAVQTTGYVMGVTNGEGNNLTVKVRSKNNNGIAPGTLFLLVYDRQGVKFSHQENDNSAQWEVIIDKTKLAPGISYVTLFDKDRQPLCERLVFSRSAPRLAGELKTDKPVYGLRQPVDLSVLVKSDIGGDWLDGSVSVYQQDSLEDINGPDIDSYLSLVSELKGSIEAPAYYFSTDAAVEEATDNLLLTQGWRRFRKPDQKKQVAFRYLPETNGQIVSGRVMNVTNNKAVAGADCSLSVPSMPFGFYLGHSDSVGIVNFEVHDYYGSGSIIAQIDVPEKNNYRVDFLSPFSDEPAYLPVAPLSLSVRDEDLLLHKSIGMQALNIYTGDSIRKFIAPILPDTLPFYGKAEYRYMLDDYKRFTTMEEVLREYVTPINVALRNGKLYMSIFDETTREVYHDDILVLLDGVPLADYNKIFQFDPLKIKKLEIVPRHYIYKSRFYAGIASFESYDGKFNGFELDPALIAVDYDGLQLNREFYSPQYSSGSNDRIPDLRTTLYWNAGVGINDSKNTILRFYTSDQKGKFRIVFQGVSNKGQIVSASNTFEVR